MIISIVALLYILLESNSIFLDFKCLRDPSCSDSAYKQVLCDERILSIQWREIHVLLMIALYVFIGILLNIIFLFKSRKSKK